MTYNIGMSLNCDVLGYILVMMQFSGRGFGYIRVDFGNSAVVTMY